MLRQALEYTKRGFCIFNSGLNQPILYLDVSETKTEDPLV